jgi:hypothetical protein
MRPPIITLTSDFGAGDGYVAAMKGVMLSILHGVTLVDSRIPRGGLCQRQRRAALGRLHWVKGEGIPLLAY